MTDRVVDAPDLTLGDLLRRARERRGLSVQDVAAITRIPHRHLVALERGHLDVLPGGMYRRAEVRTYAETVGLDKAVALAHLERALAAGTVHPPAAAAPAVPEPALHSRSTAILMATALLAAAGVTYWWWQAARAPDAAEAALEAALAAQSSAAQAVTPAGRPDAVADVPAAVAAHPSTARPSPDASLIDGGDPAASTEETARAGGQPPAFEAALTVTSAPPGARVLVDGIGRGSTPITVRHLHAGEVRVRVVLDGYISAERSIRLGRSAPATLDVKLEPHP